MGSDYKVYWTIESNNNLESILNFLKESWTQREIKNFSNRLSKLISLIKQNPFLFPISQYNPRLRKAALSKQITIFYKISGQIIYLTYLFNNKQNIDGIK